VSIDFQELRELLGTLSQTDITELTLKSDDFELTVRKGTAIAIDRTAVVAPLVENSLVPPPPKQVTTPTSSPETAATAPTADKKWVDITSPMVGTFYRAPAPDEQPFVDVGDRVTKGQVVCIIEAMKLMNEFESDFSGQVVEILVQNGEPVEYGQILMRVNP
jgi:acetyl-CoA carboxylase biotin carboxyl carrier protein